MIIGIIKALFKKKLFYKIEKTRISRIPLKFKYNKKHLRFAWETVLYNRNQFNLTEKKEDYNKYIASYKLYLYIRNSVYPKIQLNETEKIILEL